MTTEGQIKSFIDRVLRLKEEQDAIGADIRDVYAEAKSMGFDKTALGNVVAHVRKIEKKGADSVSEQSAIFDMYLSAYERPHAPAPARARENIEEIPPHDAKPVDREARRKQRTSEAMDDNKALSAELLGAGLITQEAHDENIRISDGVARKLGAGVVNDETGETIKTTEQRENVPSQHEVRPGSTSPGTEQQCDTLGVTAGETASHFEPGDDEVGAVNAQSGLPDTAGVEPSSPEPIKKSLRPHCLNPDMCAGSGRDHCFGCRKAMREREGEAA